MSRRSRTVSWALVGLVLAFLFAPVILVVLFSFNSTPNTSLPFEGFSLHWYSTVFGEETFIVAIEHSAEAAALTVAVDVIVGTLAAIGLTRVAPRLTAALTGLFLVPLVIPLLFIGIALLTFFSRLQIELSMATIVVGHVVVTLPIVILIVASRLERLDPTVMEAARDLGASAPQTFRRILLPQVAPALVGAALLALATSLDEFVITLFTNGGVQTVPIVIYGSLRRGLNPSVNAIASLMLLMTMTLTVLAGRFVSVRELTRRT